MALNPLLKKLVMQPAAPQPAPNRRHYLPRARVLDSMSDIDRLAVLEVHQRQIADEIAGLKSGYIYISDGKGRTHYLKLARARQRHLAKVAQSYCHWQD